MEAEYHLPPRRIEAYVKICVFVLLMERVAEIECGKPRTTIRETLRTLQASEFKPPSHRFFQRKELSRKLERIIKPIKIKLLRQFSGPNLWPPTSRHTRFFRLSSLYLSKITL